MRFTKPKAVADIAKSIGAEIIGDENQWAHGINEIHKVVSGDITFVDIEKYYRKSLTSAATIILINKRVECPPGKTLLLVINPFRAYDNLVRDERPEKPLASQVSSTARIHPSTIIEPFVIIGEHVSIGADCHIQGHVYIGDHTKIGNRVEIQAGAMLGTHAFYFQQVDSKYERWCCGGDVVIEDDVLIGAGTTINRGVSGSTVVGRGTKIDCQVQLGHGVVIGQDCILAGQVGIGGKTIIGNRVRIYGQVGIGNNLTIGDDAVLNGKAGAISSLEGGKTYFGVPAVESRKYFKQLIALRKLGTGK